MTDYPPKPRSWRNQLGSGAGECGKCKAWWTGANTAHCSACHAKFHDGRELLVDAGRVYPCWRSAAERPDLGGDAA